LHKILINRIYEKLTIHSQHDKCERLDYLIQRFLTRELKPDVQDVHYAVISMLLNLATNPLESIYYKANKIDHVQEYKRFDEAMRREIDIADEVRILLYFSIL
jgi:hypothetical protein